MFSRCFLISSLLLPLSYLLGNYSVIPEAGQLKILTPDLAERKTLKIKLDNGLEAYLISDPKADQSAAVLVLKAGFWDDPADHPGTAHFLEHMLFLGTKQYPIEDEYSRFITENGGTNNAMTTADFTSYMFSIQNEAFPQALNRFSSFFKDPLFNSSGVEREMNAVDQEFGVMKDDDTARSSFVLKELANVKHPFHNFNVGSRETLKRVSQETLKEWYANHYSANLMKLLVYSNMPLDQLTPLVVQDFSGIANKNLPEYNDSASLLTQDIKEKFIYVTPKKDIHTLTLIWELPEKFASMLETEPDHVLCNILGHEGKESLLADLKKDNLAESISCGGIKLSHEKIMLAVYVGLTQEGIGKKNVVIERIFQLLALLREKGIPEYLFNEMQKLDVLKYQLQTRSEPFEMVTQYANLLPYEDMSTFPEYSEVIQRFDPEAVQELLRILTPENATYILLAPPELTGVKTDKEEQWMKVPYTVTSIDPQLIRQWNSVQPNPNIQIPPPNPFIPNNANVVPAVGNPAEIPVPKLIVNDSLGMVYFANNSQYGTPEVFWAMDLRTPAIQPGNSLSNVLGELYVKGLNEILKDTSYNATLAGLNLDIARSEFGILININGYADKADLLLKDVFKAISEYSITEEQFETYKATLTRDYQNYSKEKPYLQASELMRKAIYKDYSTNFQKAKAIAEIDYNKFKSFVGKLWEKSFVQGMAYGQLQESQVKDAWNVWTNLIKSSPYPAGKLAHLKAIALPEKKGPFYIEKKINTQGNAILLGIESSGFSLKEFAAEQILGQAIGQSFFTELRTKQQTGYIVFGYADEIEKNLWLFLLTQSNTHDPRDLLARFELFIEGYLRNLKSEEIPQERFKTIQQALLTIIKKPMRNTEEMGSLLNKLAFKYDGDFDWVSKRIQGFEELSYDEFLNFTESVLGKENRRRIAVILYGVLPKELALEYQRIYDFDALRKLGNYNSGMKRP